MVTKSKIEPPNVTFFIFLYHLVKSEAWDKSLKKTIKQYHKSCLLPSFKTTWRRTIIEFLFYSVKPVNQSFECYVLYFYRPLQYNLLIGKWLIKSFLEDGIANFFSVIVTCNNCRNGHFNYVKYFLLPRIVINSFPKNWTKGILDAFYHLKLGSWSQKEIFPLMVIIITSISVPKPLITTSTRCRSTKLDGEFIILDSTFPLESFISGTDWKIWIDWTNDRSSGILLLFKYGVTA